MNANDVLNTDPKTPQGAFLNENPYAARAIAVMSKSVVNVAECQQATALATLATAFEQRQLRFDLLGIARREL